MHRQLMRCCEAHIQALTVCSLPRRRQEEKGLGHVNLAWLNPSKPGGGLPDEPTYDMMLTVDAVHDMARPDQVLPLVRKVSLSSAGFLMLSRSTAACISAGFGQCSQTRR